MGDSQHEYLPSRFIDAIHDAVGASAGTSTTLKLSVEKAADPLWVVGQRTIDEVDCRDRDCFREPLSKGTGRRTGEDNLVGVASHF